MKVYFIGAGPGDPELITVRGLKIIQQSQYCIYAGSLVNPELLKALPPRAKIYDSSGMSLEDMGVVYKEAREQNLDVARIHSGDPSIYGAIQEQMQVLDTLGIPYEVIPGVSSFVASAAVLRQELTLPGVTQTIVITRMEGKTPIPEKEHLSVLAAATPTLCIFLSIDKIEEIVRTLLPHYGKDCPVAVVYKATWPEQKIVCTRLAEIASEVKRQSIKKSALVIVGWTLGKEFQRSVLYRQH
ncbi:MAG: precorrin-4 C(11)-methyltransferase [Candidatus Brocadia sp.]|jgi:precorrin-4/cobalt-precorrin-4 C11-methyltransferase|uniref:Precorrin-4 C11-methyltransferase n=1 Tax=Candidatus Brocadia fulgida TaxID=380242 RepID=A0A0M2V0Z0_9BACT|nr:MAG: precorrin-4 C11-methyltransferase [Candidatus Brocadia fulgida]OQY98404.1 MAG: precorrin-4 C(11)-methyltransferase [Candidatus Brocadia sp. UTAMX2]UJS21525.1 MAG: precorrin-4 C(11)-methyltransferase [Candidatus Brocadia sp.]